MPAYVFGQINVDSLGVTIAFQTVMQWQRFSPLPRRHWRGRFRRDWGRSRHRRRVRETALRIRDGNVCCQFSNRGFGCTDEFRAKPIDCKPSRLEWTVGNSYK